MKFYHHILRASWVFLATGMVMAMANGEGIPIASCDDLQNKIANDMNGHYYLTQNIDCSNKEFTPIGAKGIAFLGQLDGGIYDLEGNYTGKNYTVSNLYIAADKDNDDAHRALFWQLGSHSSPSPALIKNINFTAAEVLSVDLYHRALIAAQAESAQISNIHVDGLRVWTQGKQDLGYAGGIVAYAHNIDIYNVHIKNVEIQKNLIAGGLIGMTMPGTVIEKSSVVGLNSGGAECDAYYMAHYNCAFGGLIGHIHDQDKLKPEDNVTIKESSAEGRIDTRDNIGGLVGFIEPFVEVQIKNSYANVRLVPTCKDECEYAGGLIGRADIEQDNYPVKLEYVYALGEVKPNADRNARAIIGHKGQQGSTRVQGSASYFNTQTVKKNHSGDKISQSLNTATMQDADGAEFANWDRSIWEFVDGKYPALIAHKQ